MNKRNILVVALVVLTMGATAQNVQTADTVGVVNDSAQTTPVKGNTIAMFPGGQEKLMKFLSKHIEYPDAAKAYDVEGTVTMMFYVNEDGSISDISAYNCKLDRFNTSKFSQETEARQKQLKEQFAKLFAKEGARVIRKMPKWIPGEINGKAVRTRENLRIQFNMPLK